MACNQALPKKNFNYSLLKINKRLKHVFKEQPTKAYHRNKNLRDFF